jgi:hypothetical protein
VTSLSDSSTQGDFEHGDFVLELEHASTAVPGVRRARLRRLRVNTVRTTPRSVRAFQEKSALTSGASDTQLGIEGIWAETDDIPDVCESTQRDSVYKTQAVAILTRWLDATDTEEQTRALETLKKGLDIHRMSSRKLFRDD